MTPSTKAAGEITPQKIHICENFKSSNSHYALGFSKDEDKTFSVVTYEGCILGIRFCPFCGIDILQFDEVEAGIKEN